MEFNSFQQENHVISMVKCSCAMFGQHLWRLKYVEHGGVVTSLARTRQNTPKWQGYRRGTLEDELNSNQQEKHVISMVKCSCARFEHHPLRLVYFEDDGVVTPGT
jgi:hypothetical protein